MSSSTRIVPLLLAGGLAACTGTTPAGPDGTTPPPTDSAALTLETCATTGGQLAHTWSVDNGHGDVSAMALSVRGTVAVAGADGSIKLWNLESGANDWSADPTAAGGAGYGSEFSDGAIVTALAFGQDGLALASADAQGGLGLWDTETGVASAALPGAGAAARAIALVADEMVLVAGDGADLVQLWEPGGAVVPVRTGLWGVNDVAAIPGTQQAVLAGHWYGEPSLEIVDLSAPDAAPRAVILSGFGALEAVDVSPDGALAVAVADGVSIVFDLAQLEEADAHAVVVTDEGRGADVAWLPDADGFATASVGGLLTLRDADGRDTTMLEVAAVAAMAVDAAGEQLVLVSASGDIQLIGCTE